MSNNKVTTINNKFSQKKFSDNRKEKDGTNSILVTVIVTVPKQGHKQQSHDDKQKGRSKQPCQNTRGESSDTTTNASIEE